MGAPVLTWPPIWHLWAPLSTPALLWHSPSRSMQRIRLQVWVWLLTLPDTLVIVLIVILSAEVSAVSLYWGRDHDAFWEISLRLESHGVGSVLDHLGLAVRVDVAVLALHGTVSKTSLDLEGSVA